MGGGEDSRLESEGMGQGERPKGSGRRGLSDGPGLTGANRQPGSRVPNCLSDRATRRTGSAGGHSDRVERRGGTGERVELGPERLKQAREARMTDRREGPRRPQAGRRPGDPGLPGCRGRGRGAAKRPWAEWE
ncbi:uncharacterized protein LOC115837592 [Nomascus leucogenys]|uniref:uncharacterized protein LOC115837592 n=1 Tax=Nomascus leucogenys TaxID=61853 RepID=UPI00122D8BDA|nr:uncharacterized protein LOC115837592 [Nomascus leucogenys]